MTTRTLKSRLAALESYRILDTPPEAAFDDIAELAAHVCKTRTALVSFVAEDRQWFKARRGFDQCETGIESSVCVHVIREDDILVIEDLTADARTKTNPLVTQDGGIRFYAGAPIRVSNGEAIGALCVIDTDPRPGGLSEEQRRLLASLASQVVDQLELRRRIDERDVALNSTESFAAAAVRREAWWHGMFESLTDGFILGEAIRDHDGRMIDWRYIEVNSAGATLVGRSRDEIIGMTIREFLPTIESYWIDDPAEALDTGETVPFSQEVSALDKSYTGRFAPVGNDRFTVIFHDLTERIAREGRQSGLLRLGEALRGSETVSDATEQVVRIVGETLDADRAAIGWFDAARTILNIEHDWTVDGVPGLAKHHDLNEHGEAAAIVLAGEPFMSTGDGAAPSLGHTLFGRSSSSVSVPILDRHRTVGLLFVETGRPRLWSEEELVFLQTVSDRVEASVGRIRADEQQRVLNEELVHRVKNTLTMVQAIATHTMRPLADNAAVSTFSRRLATLASAHDILLRREWKAADLGETARAVLETAGQLERVEVEGPPISLGARATLSASLLFHELATNAAKYGALSVPDGFVRLVWHIDEQPASPELVLTWQEHGGPPAEEPGRAGFGSRLIRMGLLGQGDVEVSYESTGFSTAMRAPIVELN